MDRFGSEEGEWLGYGKWDDASAVAEFEGCHRVRFRDGLEAEVLVGIKIADGCLASVSQGLKPKGHGDRRLY